MGRFRVLVLCSDYLFKLLLIGDSSVGKSCLLLRFAVRDSFLLQISLLILDWENGTFFL
jgi:GTPase SAR1 family protein